LSEHPTSTCSVCSTPFVVRFRYQVREEDAAGGTRFVYTCSQVCQQLSMGAALQGRAEATGAPGTAGASAGRCVCDVCAKRFALEYPYQVDTKGPTPRYFCSMPCRSAAAAGAVRVNRMGVPKAKGPRRIAVFNHKGGTGKTTTAVNLAAGLADTGHRVLLVDADGQGSVGASLGIRGEHSLYHVLVGGLSPERVAIPVRKGLDVITANETLAAAELLLAGRPNRDRVLRDRLSEGAQDYDVVVLDCAPALSLMNQNALVFSDSVLVPVSCDYLSLVGVKQVLKTLKNVRELLKHEIAVLGVLPTFFDARSKVARDAVSALVDHFGERCLPPIRANTKLAEAPSVKKTVFEHAPDSHGALDYRALVDHVRRLRGDVTFLDRMEAAAPRQRLVVPRPEPVLPDLEPPPLETTAEQHQGAPT
jgi:chromosome partitioning protein